MYSFDGPNVLTSKFLEPPVDDSVVPLFLLEEQHTEYREFIKAWETISDLREGGAVLLNKAEKYCPKRSPDEDDDIYRLRLKRFTYTPVMNTSIRELISKLVSAPIHFTGGEDHLDFWNKFRANNNSSDLNQVRNEEKLLNEIFDILLYFGRCYLAVDTHVLTTQPRSLLEAESFDILPFVVVYDPRHVINWGEGWFITKQFYTKALPLTIPQTICRWTIWDVEKVRVYEAQVYLGQINPWQIEKIVVGGVPTLITNLRHVSVEKVNEWTHNLGRSPMTMAKLRPALWIGNTVYQKQLQHTMIESGWTEAGAIAGTIQRVLTPNEPPPLDDTRISYEQPDYQQELKNTGNSYVMIAKDFRFVESTGAAINSITSQLQTIESQIKSLVSMGYSTVSPDKGPLQQSGISKQVDQTMLQESMKAYGAEVTQAYNAVLNNVATLMGYQAPSIVGLNNYQTDTLDSLLSTAKDLKTIAVPPTVKMVVSDKISNSILGSAPPDMTINKDKELKDLFNKGAFNAGYGQETLGEDDQLYT